MKKLATALILSGVIALTAGCAKPDSAAPTAAQSGEVQVVLRNMQYSPNKLTVKAGTRVTFVNGDAIAHDVVQSLPQDVNKAKPGFTSGPLGAGQSWSMVFEKPGTYPILCTQGMHFTAGMTGTITVTP